MSQTLPLEPHRPPSLAPLSAPAQDPKPTVQALLSQLTVGEKGDLVFSMPVTFEKTVDVNAMVRACMAGQARGGPGLAAARGGNAAGSWLRRESGRRATW